MYLNTDTYRKDTRWPVGRGYGPVVNGGPSQRDVNSIRAILIHTTNNSNGNTNYVGEAAFLRDSADVSCHYVVSSHDSTVAQVLPDKWIAWHAGDCADNDYQNATSIGIEIAWTINKGNLPAIAIENVTELVTSLLQKYPHITKIDMHRAQAVPKGRKSDPSGWNDAPFYAWRDATLKAARQAPSQPPQQPQDGLPVPLRVIGVQPSIKLDTFRAVLRERQAPFDAQFFDVIAERLYTFAQWLDIDPALFIAIWTHEQGRPLGGSELGKKSMNPFNIRAYGRWPTVRYNGADWNAYESWQLGCMAALFHLKQFYGAAGRLAVEDIIPVFAPASDGNTPSAYINAVRTDIAAMRKREA